MRHYFQNLPRAIKEFRALILESGRKVLIQEVEYKVQIQAEEGILRAQCPSLSINQAQFSKI
jgi:hypothetical protein